MTHSNTIPSDFHDLLPAVIEGALTDAQRDRLRDVIRRHADARSLYLDYIRTHVLIQMQFGSLALMREPDESTLKQPTFDTDRPGVMPRRSANLLLVAATIVLAATAWFFVRSSAPSNPQSPTRTLQPYPVATLTNLENAVLASEPPQLGSALPTGPIQLISGKAQIMFASDAVVDLTGPCEFHMNGENQGTLLAGSLEAYVPEKAHGFVLDLPHDTRVVDLGTRFHVTVDADGNSRIRVLEGTIQLEAGTTRRLVAPTTARAVQGVIGVNAVANGDFAWPQLDQDVAHVEPRDWKVTPNEGRSGIQMLGGSEPAFFWNEPDGSLKQDGIDVVDRVGQVIDLTADLLATNTGAYRAEASILIDGQPAPAASTFVASISEAEGVKQIRLQYRTIASDVGKTFGVRFDLSVVRSPVQADLQHVWVDADRDPGSETNHRSPSETPSENEAPR